MQNWISTLLDKLSESLAHRKGLLPLIGVGLVFIDMLIALVMPDSYLVRSGILLHIGVIVAVLGLLLGRAL